MSKIEAFKAGMALIASLAGSNPEPIPDRRPPPEIAAACGVDGRQYVYITQALSAGQSIDRWTELCKALRDEGIVPADFLARWPHALTAGRTFLKNIQALRADGFRRPLLTLTRIPNLRAPDFALLTTARLALEQIGVDAPVALLEAHPELIPYAEPVRIGRIETALAALGRTDAHHIIARNPRVLMIGSIEQMIETATYLRERGVADAFDVFARAPGIMNLRRPIVAALFTKLESLGLRDLGRLIDRVPQTFGYVTDGSFNGRLTKLKAAGVRDAIALINLFPEALGDPDHTGVRVYVHLTNDRGYSHEDVAATYTFPPPAGLLDTLESEFRNLRADVGPALTRTPPVDRATQTTAAAPAPAPAPADLDDNLRALGFKQPLVILRLLPELADGRLPLDVVRRRMARLRLLGHTDLNRVISIHPGVLKQASLDLDDAQFALITQTLGYSTYYKYRRFCGTFAAADGPRLIRNYRHLVALDFDFARANDSVVRRKLWSQDLPQIDQAVSRLTRDDQKLSARFGFNNPWPALERDPHFLKRLHRAIAVLERNGLTELVTWVRGNARRLDLLDESRLEAHLASLRRLGVAEPGRLLLKMPERLEVPADIVTAFTAFIEDRPVPAPWRLLYLYRDNAVGGPAAVLAALRARIDADPEFAALDERDAIPPSIEDQKFKNPRRLVKLVPTLLTFTRHELKSRLNGLPALGFREPREAIEKYPGALRALLAGTLGARLDHLRGSGFVDPFQMILSSPDLLDESVPMTSVARNHILREWFPGRLRTGGRVRMGGPIDAARFERILNVHTALRAAGIEPSRMPEALKRVCLSDYSAADLSAPVVSLFRQRRSLISHLERFGFADAEALLKRAPFVEAFSTIEIIARMQMLDRLGVTEVAHVLAWRPSLLGVSAQTILDNADELLSSGAAGYEGRPVAAFPSVRPPGARTLDHLRVDWKLPAAAFSRELRWPISAARDAEFRARYSELMARGRSIDSLSIAERMKLLTENQIGAASAGEVEYLRRAWRFDDARIATLSAPQIRTLLRKGRRIEARGLSPADFPAPLRARLLNYSNVLSRQKNILARLRGLGFADTERMVTTFPTLRYYQTSLTAVARAYARKAWDFDFESHASVESDPARFERIYVIEQDLAAVGVTARTLPSAVRKNLYEVARPAELRDALARPPESFALRILNAQSKTPRTTDLTFANALRITQTLHQGGFADPVQYLARFPHSWSTEATTVEEWFGRNQSLSPSERVALVTEYPRLLTDPATAENDSPAADSALRMPERLPKNADRSTVAHATQDHLATDWGLPRRPLRESNYEFLAGSFDRLRSNYEALVRAGANPAALGEDFKASCLKNLNAEQLSRPLDDAFPYLVSRARFLVRLGFTNGNTVMKQEPGLRKMSLAQIAAALQRLSAVGRDPRSRPEFVPLIKMALEDIDALPPPPAAGSAGCETDLSA